MAEHSITGIIPVLFSYFDADGGLRLDAFGQQLDHCLREGASGVMIFGFGTQFYRLTPTEKLEILDYCAHHLHGRGTLGVTVTGETVETQIALARAAERAGAHWLILQPPPGPPVGGARWLPVVERVAAATSLPIAIQNAAIAGSTLSMPQIEALASRCPTLSFLKAETETLAVADLITRMGHRLSVIAGNFGVDYPFLRQVGAQGMIPGPNFVGEFVKMHRAFEPGGGGMSAAMALHEAVMPLTQLIRDSHSDIGLLIGKRAFAHRSGIDPGGERMPMAGPLDARLAAHIDALAERLETSLGEQLT